MMQTILLGEDDEDDVQIFLEVLASLNQSADVTVGMNGAEVLQFLNAATTLPQLVFLDLNMPIKNGFQCLSEIRARPEWRGLRVVILSTSSQPEQIEKARAEGADDYCVKPNSYNEFRELLKAFLSAV